VNYSAPSSPDQGRRHYHVESVYTTNEPRIVKSSKRLLNTIYSQSIDSETIQEEVNTIKYVLEFAIEWEMSMIIDLIRKEISRDIDSKSTRPMLLIDFILALGTGDNALAAACFGSDKKQKGVAPKSPDDGWTSNKGRSGTPYHSVNSAYDSFTSLYSSSAGPADDVSDNEDQDESAQNPPLSALPDYYLSDQPAIGLYDDMYQDLVRGGNAFDLSTAPYSDFLHIPPTVLWIM
jgi:hypothetical protein